MDARELLSENLVVSRLNMRDTRHPMRIQHVSDIVRLAACKKYPSSAPPFDTDVWRSVDVWTAASFSTNTAATAHGGNGLSAVGLGLVTGDPKDSASAVGPVRTGAWFADLDTVLLRPMIMRLRTSGGVYATMPAEECARFNQTELQFLTRPVRTPGAMEWQAFPAYFCEGSNDLKGILGYAVDLIEGGGAWPYRAVMQRLTETIRANGHTCDILPPEVFSPIRLPDALKIFSKPKAGRSQVIQMLRCPAGSQIPKLAFDQPARRVADCQTV